METDREVSLKRAFERAVRSALGPLVRKDDSRAQDLWAALANVEWASRENEMVAYSFREAAQFVADLHGASHYMDWYCRGPAALVSAEIRDALAQKGWRPLELPNVGP